MGSNDEFGPDTETIRAWLNKRASYAKDARVIGAPRGGRIAPDPSPPAIDTPVDPMPAPVDTVPRPSGPDSTSAGRSVLAALGAENAEAAAPAAASVDTTAAGRSVVDALSGPSKKPRRGSRPKIRPAKPEVRISSDRPTPAPDSPTRESAARAAGAPPVRVQPTVQTTAAPQVKQSRWTEPEDHLNANHASTDADFPVRGGARRVLSVILLGALAATAVASYVANEDRTVGTVGVAGTLAFLTLVIWAVRAGCTTTKLAIRRGQLSIERGGHVELVDIGSPYTPVAIVGEPGHRHWTVLVERPGLPLVVINSSMVDAHWFTSALYRLRPELRPGAADEAGYAEDESYAEAT